MMEKSILTVVFADLVFLHIVALVALGQVMIYMLCYI